MYLFTSSNPAPSIGSTDIGLPVYLKGDDPVQKIVNEGNFLSQVNPNGESFTGYFPGAWTTPRRRGLSSATTYNYTTLGTVGALLNGNFNLEGPYLWEAQVNTEYPFRVEGGNIYAASFRLVRPLLATSRHLAFFLLNELERVIAEKVGSTYNSVMTAAKLKILTGAGDDLLKKANLALLPQRHIDRMATIGGGGGEREKGRAEITDNLPGILDSISSLSRAGTSPRVGTYLREALDSIYRLASGIVPLSAIDNLTAHLNGNVGVGFANVSYDLRPEVVTARYEEAKETMAQNLGNVGDILLGTVNVAGPSRWTPDRGFTNVLFKVVSSSGKAIHHSATKPYVWNKPTRLPNGDWTPAAYEPEVHGQIAACANGLHLAPGLDVFQWFGNSNNRNEPISLFLAEVKVNDADDIAYDTSKIAVRNARLLRGFRNPLGTPVNIRAAVAVAEWALQNFPALRATQTGIDVATMMGDLKVAARDNKKNDAVSKKISEIRGRSGLQRVESYLIDMLNTAMYYVGDKNAVKATDNTYNAETLGSSINNLVSTAMNFSGINDPGKGQVFLSGALAVWLKVADEYQETVTPVQPGNDKRPVWTQTLDNGCGTPGCTACYPNGLWPFSTDMFGKPTPPRNPAEVALAGGVTTTTTSTTATTPAAALEEDSADFDDEDEEEEEDEDYEDDEDEEIDYSDTTESDLNAEAKAILQVVLDRVETFPADHAGEHIRQNRSKNAAAYGHGGGSRVDYAKFKSDPAYAKYVKSFSSPTALLAVLTDTGYATVDQMLDNATEQESSSWNIWDEFLGEAGDRTELVEMAELVLPYIIKQLM